VGAWLQLPRADGLRFHVPDAPGLCETCRGRAATAAGYCTRLCAMFDAALDELAAAIEDAAGERLAPAVVAARTRLRAIAAVYDAPDGIQPGVVADWSEDVAAGLLLPVPFALAVARVRELAAGADPAPALDVPDRT